MSFRRASLEYIMHMLLTVRVSMERRTLCDEIKPAGVGVCGFLVGLGGAGVSDMKM